GDVDTFVVTAPPGNAGQIIQYSLRGYSQMSAIVEILDANRAPLNRNTGGPGVELRGWVHVAGDTPIYIRVSQYHTANEPYMLSLAAGPLAEAGEPNAD